MLHPPPNDALSPPSSPFLGRSLPRLENMSLNYPLCSKCDSRTDQYKNHDKLVTILYQDKTVIHPIVLYKGHKIMRIVVDHIAVNRKTFVELSFHSLLRSRPS